MGSFHRHSMKTKQFGDKRRFERHHTLAKFYVAQVLLYAELCLGRSYNCIGKLETMFPFELVVSCMLNTLLPDEVRAAFAVLMAHLHVEREPQIHHQYPQLVRLDRAAMRIHLDIISYHVRWGTEAWDTPVGLARGDACNGERN